MVIPVNTANTPRLTWRSALKGLTVVSALLAMPAGRADDVPPLPPPPAGYHWQAVPALTDEFKGPSLDTKKWLNYHPYWKGREPSHFEPSNVSVSGGQLRLRSDTLLPDLTGVKDPEKDVWVRSACVSSATPIAGPGYYEARMKASALSMTSSFWLQGKYSEIDVVEEVGRSLKNPDNDSLMQMNTHYFAEGWEHDKSVGAHWRMPAGAADGYHVYGVWWKDKNTVLFYHDGHQVAPVQTGGEFAEPMYLFFDTEVFKWEGLPTLESLKDSPRNTMSVDWVRAWRLAPQ